MILNHYLNNDFAIFGAGNVKSDHAHFPANVVTMGVNNACMIYQTDIGIYKEKPFPQWFERLHDYRGTLLISEYSHGNYERELNKWSPPRSELTHIFNHYHNRTEGIDYCSLIGYYPNRPLYVGTSTTLSAIDFAVSCKAKKIFLIGASGRITDKKVTIESYGSPNSDSYSYKKWLNLYRFQLSEVTESVKMLYGTEFIFID